jgi:two-component system NtrC family sensor kinase
VKERRDAAVRSIRIIMAACVVVPALLFAYAAWNSYRSAHALADERILRTLQIVSEQALRVFQSIDVTFGSIEQMASGHPPHDELNERLKQMVLVLPDVEAIWLIDPQGRVTSSSSKYMMASEAMAPPAGPAAADGGGGSEMTIGDIVAGTTSDTAFFPVFARRKGSDGRDAGMTVVSVLPAAFERFYGQLAEDDGVSFALLREDGAVLARYPRSSRGIRLDPGGAFRRAVEQGSMATPHTTPVGIDGVERRFAVQRLTNFPLYVVSTTRTTDITVQWLTQVAAYLVIMIAVVAPLLMLLWLVLRRTEEVYGEAARREVAEANLRQSQKMEAIGQLTGGVAHDFNNLLTIVIGNLDSALRQNPEGRLQRALVNAMSGAERAAQLTRRLLAFSRKQPLKPRAIDANGLVAGMSEMLARSLGGNITIETVYAKGLWPVEADPVELESALLNLAINARDAMKGSGRMTIRTANTALDAGADTMFDSPAPGDYVMIAVSDTGEGMSAEVIEKAFDPFFTTKALGAGTGLGLSQVYGFVKQSGGYVRIASEVGRGATMMLYLPRAAAAPSAARPQAVSAPRSGVGRTVLVVEDDAAVRSYIVEVLRDLDYSVIDVGDGEAALRIVERPDQVIDLLLTDVVMPRMNGRVLADEVERRRPGIKVLFMTGYARDAIAHDGRLDSGISLIQKPIMRDDLAARIEGLLAAA